MWENKTQQLVIGVLGSAFIIFLFLANKSIIFRNCSLLSLAIMLLIIGYKDVKEGNEIGIPYGKIKIIIGAMIILAIFHTGNKTALTLIQIGCFAIIFIYYKLTITKQHPNIFAYMGLLVLGNGIVSALLVEWIFNILSLPKAYMNIVFIFIYFAMWIIMSLYGQVSAMKKCDLLMGAFWIIALMISTFFVDVITPTLLQQNDLGKAISVFASELGYAGKDILKIAIQLITYPFIIIVIVSYIIVHFREYKV
ncbi:MAG: hypothetical protein E7211_08855 [Clostridium lundense]|nr:hypothetical protein [Clostridium lundense]